MDEATFKKDLADIIQSMFTRTIAGVPPEPDTYEVDVPVLYADKLNENAGSSRPPYPYITIRVGSIVKRGWDSVGPVDDDGIVEIGGQRNVTVTVEYFGESPVEYAMAIVANFEKPSIHAKMLKAGIAFIRVSPVQNLTGIGFNGSLYEERSSFDLFVGIADNTSDEVGIIEKVFVEETVTSGSETLIDGEVFEVDVVTPE
jgi:hypothetical protein